MEEIIYFNDKMQYRGFWYSVGQGSPIDDICLLNLYDDENNFNIMLVANKTIINGILQTSAQMIIDTLTNA